ncbi:MAG: exo-alpha-sialidase [Clostridia bacterium]|nr:exo-alpha-sialidase [Clostridia bacterium]
MELLANDFTTVFKSPNPENTYLGTPSICVMKSGRYVVSHDLFTKNEENRGFFSKSEDIIPHPISGNYNIGQIFVSDDKGKSWRMVARRNFYHAVVFESGDELYLFGHCNDLIIYRSLDGGESWDMGHYLTENEYWHASATNIWYEKGYINLIIETYVNKDGEIRDGWNVSSLAPVVLRAKIGDDLTKRESWVFSDKVRFRDIVNEDELDLHGIPFFPTTLHKSEYPAGTTTDNMSGWLEANIVRIKDEKHYWYDPSGKTFHIIMRAHTSWTGYCAIMKAVIEEKNGKETIKIMPEVNPSGKKVVYLPLPGGQMRFHITWDEKSQLFWLLSTQATDSMTRKELLPADRFNLPYDERRRMQLSFSKNLVDWCFAGMVAIGDTERESRHYASMEIDGDDLVLVSRSGSPKAYSPHNVDLITFHRVKNFRELVY